MPISDHPFPALALGPPFCAFWLGWALAALLLYAALRPLGALSGEHLQVLASVPMTATLAMLENCTGGD